MNFDNFDNSHNSFLWPEYFINYSCERWIPWHDSTSVLCLHYRPLHYHCSTEDAYTWNNFPCIKSLVHTIYMCTPYSHKKHKKPHRTLYVYIYIYKNRWFYTVLCKIQNTGHCTFISYTLQFYASYSSSRPTLILGTERRVGAGLPGSQPRIYFPANFRYRRTRSNHSRSIPFRKL